MKGVCDKFVECYKGSATVKECPPGTVFCVKSLMCDWPTKAVCDRVGMEQSVTMSSSVHSVSSSVSSSNLFRPLDQSPSGHHQPAFHQPASDEQYEDTNWSGNALYDKRNRKTFVMMFRRDSGKECGSDASAPLRAGDQAETGPEPLPGIRPDIL